MPVKAIIQTGYPLVRKIDQSQYNKKIKFSTGKQKIKINQNLPFRVKFMPGTISEYSANNPAPIGIAVIGVNNYIL